MQAQRCSLPDGRWHFQHGPIDLIIGAQGHAPDLAAAHEAAWHRFETVLTELVSELPALRQPVRETCTLTGRVARRMWQACHPFRRNFITPMAAVAGSVAQELLTAYQRPGVSRAWINNGGDIAVHLTPGQSVRVGLYANPSKLDVRQLEDGLSLDGQFTVTHDSPIRGVATSGWRGRSFSLGIADSVTVLAATAAQADAAATVIGNAVNAEDPHIQRAPACTLRDDTDLGTMAVTTAVPPLPRRTLERALDGGLACAQEWQRAGLIAACVITCQGLVVSTMAHEAGLPSSPFLCQEAA